MIRYSLNPLKLLRQLHCRHVWMPIALATSRHTVACKMDYCVRCEAERGNDPAT